MVLALCSTRSFSEHTIQENRPARGLVVSKGSNVPNPPPPALLLDPLYLPPHRYLTIGNPSFANPQDTLGFAGMKMIRRVVGISHVEDLEGIEDRPTRARCESHAVALGKRLVFASSGGSVDVDKGGPGDAAGGALATAEEVCALAKSLGVDGGAAAASGS